MEQLQTSVDPSTRAAFYQPLADAIRRAQAAAGPEAIGERVEAIDTASHGASAYLAPSFALARGWDRQADRAYNALFYSTKSLTADSYHAWLHELAVGWVALPRAPLDYSAVAEGGLVRAGLPTSGRCGAARIGRSMRSPMRHRSLPGRRCCLSRTAASRCHQQCGHGGRPDPVVAIPDCRRSGHRTDLIPQLAWSTTMAGFASTCLAKEPSSW